jgi:hypothetical protein
LLSPNDVFGKQAIAERNLWAMVAAVSASVVLGTNDWNHGTLGICCYQARDDVAVLMVLKSGYESEVVALYLHLEVLELDHDTLQGRDGVCDRSFHSCL